MSLKENLVRVVRARSYREGDFTLASGQKSKFYIDMKATTLDPEGADLLGQFAFEVLDNKQDLIFSLRLRTASVPA